MNRQTFSLSRRGSWLSVSWLMLFLALPGISSAIVPTQVGRDWIKRNPLPTGDSIFAVSAGAPTTNPPVGGTRLVAVGGHGLILTSDDGTSWTERTSGITTDLFDVVYISAPSQLKYVAVGASSRVLTSPDGITWTPATTIGTDDLNSVVYTGNQIVAVGGTGTTGATHTSSDGTVWTRSTTAVSAGEFRQVVVVGTFLYAVSSGVKGAILKGTKVAGTWSWSKQAATAGMTAADVPLSLVYTSSRFVVCSQNGSNFNLWQSNTGTAWTASTLLSASPPLAVSHLRWTGSEVIGVGAGGEVWKSADGASFTASNRIPTGQPQFLFGGAKIGSTYVVTGEGGRIFSITPPGETVWTSRYSSGVTVNIAGAATDGTGFVAVGDNFTLTSPDGVAWTTQPQVSKSMRSAAHTGAGYVAVGSGAWTSPDGITWTETLSPATAGTLNRVIWTGTQLVAVGFDDTGAKSQIYVSDTGATWTKRTLAAGSLKPLRGAASSVGLIVAVGDAGTVQTSPDFGLTWTKRAAALPAGENFTDVVFGANLFIATTNKGGIWTSANGIAWVKRKASSVGGFNRIILTGGQIIALGISGTEAYSYGGITWTEMNVGSTQAVQDAAYAANNIVAVGTSGMILSSNGAQPVRPTLNFSASTLAVAEGAGTATLTINVAPPSPQALTVLFTLSGSAVSPADFTVPSTVVSIPANAASQTITVTIKQDVLDEVNEAAVLSLGAPTGDAVLGPTSVHTLTINDDDQIPTFTSQPSNWLVIAGVAVHFEARLAASGTLSPLPATLTASWKKNNAAAPALVTSSAVVPMPTGAMFRGDIGSPKLADAGAYVVTVKNPSGTASSAVAQLGVVDDTPQFLSIAADTTATLTAKASGNGLTFQWLKGGTPIYNSTDGRITGAATTKLVIKTVDQGDAAIYTCRVTQTTAAGSIFIDGATTTLGVLTSVPVVTSAALASTTVGQTYDFTPAASGSPNKWVMTGLPTGLNYNAVTGRITGKALVSPLVPTGSDYNLTLTASNIIGTGPSRTIILHVDPLPANATGSWRGLLARSPLNKELGGRLELDILPNGTYSGRLIQGTNTVSFASAVGQGVTFNPTGSLVTISEVIAPPASTGLPAVALDITIDPVANTIVAQTTKGADTASITAWPTNQWAGSPPANTVGLYNFSLTPPGSLTKPTGYGYGSFSIASNGAYTVAGKLADGKAYTTGGFLSKTEVAGVNEVQIYQGLYSVAGSLHGTLRVTDVLASGNYDNNKITGDLTWFKPDQGTTIPDTNRDRRSYGSGFGLNSTDTTPLLLRSDGGRYFDPTATVGSIFGGLRTASANGKLDFNAVAGPSLGSFAGDVEFTATAPANVTSVNNTSVTLSLAASTGIFSGVVTLVDPNPFGGANVTRTPTYSGIVIRRDGLSPVVNTVPSLVVRGFYNVERLPEAGLSGPTTVGDNTGNSPIESGAVLFVRNVP